MISFNSVWFRNLHNFKALCNVYLMLQGYVVCPSEKRFLLLFTFLRKNRNKKVMVFFSSCLEVKYFHELLNYIDIPVTCIHVSTTACVILPVYHSWWIRAVCPSVPVYVHLSFW